jgi:hypothetical protein
MQRLLSPVSVVVAVVLVGLAAVSSSAQTPDPLVGSWKLNLAKSKYDPGPAPRSTTLKVDAAGKGFTVAVDAVGADGKPVKWGFTSQPDGKDAPVTGNPAIDTVSSTPRTGSAGTTSYKKAGKVVSTVTTAVSADGKALTITTKGTDMQGRPVNNVAVYDRQ